MILSRLRYRSAILIAILALNAAALACQGDVPNMTVHGLPKYVCPSATPRATHTPLPPDPPTYPAAFGVTLDYRFIHPGRTLIHVQYLAQNVGTVSMIYSIISPTGSVSTSPLIALTYTGNSPGVQVNYPLALPLSMNYATLTVSSTLGSQSFTINLSASSADPAPNPPPCCLPSPIYPTPRPTFTPYPSPTPFTMVAPDAFFLDDPIYNYQPPVQLRLRMKSPIREGLFQLFIPLFAAAAWQIEITNVGSVEYDFLGAGYTYVSEMNANGVRTTGVWPSSHTAATFLGITEQAYGPQALKPGQTITIQVAAWVPVNAHVSKIALLLNPYHSGDPGWATFVPGSGKEGTVIHWTNAVNTICKGEIVRPEAAPGE
jgi:hypothetical protein